MGTVLPITSHEEKCAASLIQVGPAESGLYLISIDPVVCGRSNNETLLRQQIHELRHLIRRLEEQLPEPASIRTCQSAW